MLNEPYFSVVTVVYNDLSGLHRTSNSIRKQIFSDYEWIIVDGYSSDGTSEFIDNLVSVERIKKIQTPPSGIYDAMNIGLKESKGSWIIFLNAGDVFLSATSLVNIAREIANYKVEVIFASPVAIISPSGYLYDCTFPRIFQDGNNRVLEANHQGVVVAGPIAKQIQFDASMKYAADGKFLDQMITRGDTHISQMVNVGFELGGASTQNFRRTLNEISDYRRAPSFAPSLSRFLLILKTSMRRYLLNHESALLFAKLLSLYLIFRQNRILKDLLNSQRVIDHDCIQRDSAKKMFSCCFEYDSGMSAS